MANTSFLSTSELDFNSLRASLRGFMRSQERFRDYDYDGSNMSVLLDLLAWNTHLNAHYLNQVASEMFLDTARLQDSLYSHSKELNYTPRSVTSSRASVVFSIDTGDDSPDSVTLPKNYTVSSRYSDSTGAETSFDFLLTGSVVVKRDEDGVYVSPEVEVVEGEAVRDAFVVNSTSRYVLSSANVDVSTLEVSVRNSVTDSSNTRFTRSYNLYGVTSSDPVFFVQGAYDGRFEVVFGDGVVGQSLTPGNVVDVSYVNSSGPDSNGARVFSGEDTQEGYSVTVTTVERSTGGADREGVDSIRYYAPRHFSTQERAIIKSDFVNLVRERFPQLEAVTAYGGEEVVPKRYGKIILSVKPFGDEVATDKMKQDITDYLLGKNIVTEPVIIDADYLYVAVDCVVKYDRDSSFKTEEQVVALAEAAILAYSSGELDDFGVTFRTSRFVRAIDDSDSSVVSNDTSVRLMKKWKARTGSVQSAVFSFGNPLLSQTREKDVVNHDPIVYTSSFVYRKNGVNYDSLIQDDGDGTLVVYSLGDDGSKVVIENEVGSVDYDTGDVNASLNVFSYSGPAIRFYAVPEEMDFSASSGVYMSVSADEVRVTAERV